VFPKSSRPVLRLTQARVKCMPGALDSGFKRPGGSRCHAVEGLIKSGTVPLLHNTSCHVQRQFHHICLRFTNLLAQCCSTCIEAPQTGPSMSFGEGGGGGFPSVPSPVSGKTGHCRFSNLSRPTILYYHTVFDIYISFRAIN